MTEYLEEFLEAEKALIRITDLERKVLELQNKLPRMQTIDVGTTPSDVVYRDGKMRLLHYHPVIPLRRQIPILLVYAVINKPYIMDLQQDRSIVRALLNQGLDVYLIDWGTLSDSDRFLCLSDYVEGYINRAVDRIRRDRDVDKISMMGYCIGGYFATVYAALHPDKIKNLIIMAAPLDFSINSGLLHVWTKKEYYNVDKVVQAFGNAPSMFLNAGFVLLKPLENLCLKYIELLENIDDDEFVNMFFRMEKWISDGVPVAGEFYKEFIKYGYQENLLIKNQLKLGEKRVNIENIKMPLLVIVGEKDNLVPPDSTKTLYEIVPSADRRLISFPTGHIGLSVGSKAHKILWPDAATWIAQRSSQEEKSRSDFDVLELQKE